MPAVQLSRLTQQIDGLVWQFTVPSDFLIRLRDLFEFYADRVYRAGQAVPPATMAPAYRIPTLVMRQLELALRPACKQHPAAAMTLVDLLWTQAMLEFRLLAATLLGSIPLETASLVTEKIKSYARPDLDIQVMDALLESGGSKLRVENPSDWLALIEGWANSPLMAAQAIALRAISISARDERFNNLPPLFRNFSTMLQTGSVTLQSELQTTLLALLRRSPGETVYLLRQILSLSTSPTTQRLVRLSLSHVPPDFQPSLRQALQSHRQ